MANLVLPDSSYFITRAREGVDPFQELRAHADGWEFATCGLVLMEVCRGRSDAHVYKRFRERFAVMIFVPATSSTWERATQLAWSLDRQGIVIPATDIFIAASALQVGAAVLTYDAHFRQIPELTVLECLE
ncbi:PIN domain-containing protein [Oleiharenicola lentus]|uniref:Ribonuclease VapC n=1 Tax=Oleiharenicola lentus TaxID=2508720 RepID=A0A4Q1C841_9BACT|nr:PIN domain-containing protein [Oleiharenicola lentus]RXK55104.1 PIN domain-containing protein [Oleiharenicola lentus]